MATKYIFLSLEACNFFQIYGPPPDEWYTDFTSSYISLPSFSSQRGDVIVLTPEEMSNVRGASFATFIASQLGFLPELASTKKREAFTRILRLIQSSGDQSISIPALWKPWNAGSLIAIQTNPRGRGERARVLFDRRSHGPLMGICYGIISEDVDLVRKTPELVDLDEIQRHLFAIEEESDGKLTTTEADAFDLEVGNKVLGLGESLQTWYESKLTATQRRFCDFALSKSVRVRGPAGSGKTIAMVVKLLRQFEADRKSQKPSRYAFLTHSESTVELIRSMMRTMVSESELNTLTENGSLFYLGTLYALAFDTLGTELRGVAPLSLDGRQGRELQRELLDSIFAAYMKSNWFGRKGGCSEEFIRRLDAAVADLAVRERLLLEILNEFACVLEPEGTARSAQKREDYIQRSVREQWRMQLHKPEERRVLLDLHDQFRKEMRGMEAISMDQLIADFSRFLDSNAWELTRSVSGFDVIFVDELHLLNRLERMVITHLLRQPEAKPLVVMAEDIKQDIRRVGTGLLKWQQQLDGLQEFDLDEVFRYTPQINDFLALIDEFAPTLNLAEDWPNYQQHSRLPSGPKPDVHVYKGVREQYEAVFPRAAESARKKKSGRAIAVLTCDYSNFKQYLTAGQYRDLFIPVESREDITSIPNRGTRYIFSMPEFVAGLQFEEVYLIDVSSSVFNGEEQVGVHDKRRGLSAVYLGSSRAMTKLHMSGLMDAGGLPSFVQHAVDTGVCAPA